MNHHISNVWLTVIAIAAIWDLVWRGIALWRAGRRGQQWWFIFLLVINSVGILPIIYLLTHPGRDNPGGTAATPAPKETG